MKQSPSKGDGKKRKREICNPSSPPEVVKRKVQAQRKFAQGSGSSGHVSPMPFPVRDGEKKPVLNRTMSATKPPLLTNRVPTTNQFLDFLCFGRSDMLPPELHYLKETSLATTASPATTSFTSTAVRKDECIINSKAVPKVAEALRKKYHEQRLAKEKSSSVTKLAQKVKGKVMVRTRSAVNREDISKGGKSAVMLNKPAVVASLRKRLQRGGKPDARNMRTRKAKLQRAGLRSAGKVDEPKIVPKESLPPKAKKVDQKHSSMPENKKSRGKRSGVESVEESSDDEPLMTKRPRLQTTKKVKPMRTRSKTTQDEDKHEVDIRTRPVRPMTKPIRTSVKKIERTTAVSLKKLHVSSAESSPERPGTRKDKRDTSVVLPSKRANEKKILDQCKSEELHRRLTRSTPLLEKTGSGTSKTKKDNVIRELLQKKRQTSLKTLSRLTIASNKSLTRREVEKQKKKPILEQNAPFELQKTIASLQKGKEIDAINDLTDETPDNTSLSKEKGSSKQSVEEKTPKPAAASSVKGKDAAIKNVGYALKKQKNQLSREKPLAINDPLNKTISKKNLISKNELRPDGNDVSDPKTEKTRPIKEKGADSNNVVGDRNCRRANSPSKVNPAEGKADISTKSTKKSKGLQNCVLSEEKLCTKEVDISIKEKGANEFETERAIIEGGADSSRKVKQPDSSDCKTSKKTDISLIAEKLLVAKDEANAKTSKNAALSSNKEKISITRDKSNERTHKNVANKEKVILSRDDAQLKESNCSSLKGEIINVSEPVRKSRKAQTAGEQRKEAKPKNVLNMRKSAAKPGLDVSTISSEKNIVGNDESEIEKVGSRIQPSKRPVRKCSTVDKMWIDVDGFTSDEDDFVDMGSIVAAATKSVSAALDQKTKEGKNKAYPPGRGEKNENRHFDDALPSDNEKFDSSSRTLNDLKTEANSIKSKINCQSSTSKATASFSSCKASYSQSSGSIPIVNTTAPLVRPATSSQPHSDVVIDAKKEYSGKTFTSIVDPTLFPKTAAWLKSHETKDFERNLQKKEEAGVVSSPSAESELKSGSPSSENSHSLIARLATNNAAMTKPLFKTDLKTVAKDNKSISAVGSSSIQEYETKLLKSDDDSKEKLKELDIYFSVKKQFINETFSPSVAKPKVEPINDTPMKLPRSSVSKLEEKSNRQNHEKLPKALHSQTKVSASSSLESKLKVPNLPQNSKSHVKSFSPSSSLTLRAQNVLSPQTSGSAIRQKDVGDNSNSGKKFSLKDREVHKILDSSDESDASSEKVEKRKRTRRPSPRAEVVTRKERPKRQCSAMGKSWVDRDSDDSSFFDDDQDVMELIRRSELKLKRREERKNQKERVGLDSNKSACSEVFSESDDEPLLKKTSVAPSPSGLFSSPNIPKSLSDSVTSELTPKPEPPAPAVTFRTLPREPINTHGLDLLSEVVAVADKSSDRIEQWLKESIRADGGKGFVGFDESEIPRPPLAVSNSSIPDPVLQFVRTSSTPPKPLPTSEPMTTPVRKPTPKEELVLKRPPVSSVTDLIKLQRERKGSPKPTMEHHSKNCKCDSCVVKKGWFKNKLLPEQPKPVTKDSSPLKMEKTQSASCATSPSAKVSVCVAPMVQGVEGGITSPSPRKMSFLDRMRERERREALVKPHTPPFSPSNESSVYAFEPEPDRASGPCHNTSTAKSSHQSSTVHCHTDTQVHQSTSIAVQVNMDTGTSTTETVIADDGKSFEISTQTEVADDDPDSQMFYIPLQQSAAATSSQQPLIQGVTVKLGTEGPVGPNQKVVMQAKLVTKPPPSMKAVVMPQPKKEKMKMTPPVGTVQPTTRRPPGGSPSPRPRVSVSPSSSKSSQSCAKSQPTPAAVTRGESPLASSASKSRPSKDVPKAAAAPLPPVAKPRPTTVVEAPTFHLTEKDFQDPLEFFDRIRPAAERFGICRIVPPASFKPDCKVADDMRFTAYNQYVHRMFHRWGPSVKETMAMKKYLKTQRISLKPAPCVGGVEVDLPRLYKAVQTCGGLMKVMEKQKWQQVADILRLPKAAHDRATKLDAIYCQYLLPYDTLKDEERKKLLDEVDKDWSDYEKKIGLDVQAEEEEENYIEECEECIVKGRSMALNQFYRIARNTMSMWFKSAEPEPAEVEAEFWRLVTERKQHVCVHSGSIDSSGWGYGFPVGKNSFAKHPWNLKVLTNNSGSVLRSLGPVMGVTVPTLHVGMVFAAFCWYRDPHGLPWVEYLHTGAPKIWYGIADDASSQFRDALTKLMPNFMKEQRIWLPCDTAMVPPERLAQLGVPLSRITQHPGQFVLVFPRAFTSSLCTGYLVSESVYFARPSWLQTAEDAFRDIHSSSEPSVFSLDNLMLSIAQDNRASLELLKLVLPMVQRVREREETGRAALKALGVSEEPLPREKSPRGRRGRPQDPAPEHECEVCRATLFLSLISCPAEESVFCLEHGHKHLTEHSDQVPAAKLLYIHHQDDIKDVAEKLEDRINSKQSKIKK